RPPDRRRQQAGRHGPAHHASPGERGGPRPAYLVQHALPDQASDGTRGGARLHAAEELVQAVLPGAGRAPVTTVAVPRRVFDAHWESLDRQQLEARQLGLVKAKLEQLYANNPFYRERWRKAGLDLDRIDTLDDFARRVPTIDKQEVLADQAAHP